MRVVIMGRGAMGRGLHDALERRGDEPVAVLGRPASPSGPRPDPGGLVPIDVAFEFSHASSLLENASYALATGCRAIVIGTTGWAADHDRASQLEELIRSRRAGAVIAPTFSPAATLFGRLAEEAARLFGGLEDYDPYIFEWHRRTKPDRPSGTALALAGRVLPHLRSKTRAQPPEGPEAPDPATLEVASLRAGAAPGTHVFGFDAPGESIEIRVTARDRSAYIAGALLAADWLREDPHGRLGIHRFDQVLESRIGQEDSHVLVS